MIAYLELVDYLLIAENVLGVAAEAIANFNRIGLAQSALYAPQAGFGGVEAYPDFETKQRCSAGTSSRTTRFLTATSDVPSSRRSSLLNGTAERGCPRPAIRTRPTR